MDVILEPLTRYDHSFRYALHDAYFQNRGIGAWTDNEIPHEITTNIGTARQHVRVLLAHFLSHEAELGEGPYVVLEIGGGLGRFASNFFRALDALTEPGADRLRTRLRYVFSDVSPLSVGQAAEAQDLGIVMKVVADAELEAETLKLAQEIAGSATYALRMAKRMFQSIYTPTLEQLLEIENLAVCTARLTHDHKEGIAAFKEKRPPKFEGR